MNSLKKLDSEKESLESKIESTGQEESRVKKGSGMPSDVLQAKADLAGAQKSKIEAEGDLRKAYNKFVKVFKTEPPASIDTMQLIELSPEGKNQLPTSLDDALAKAIIGNLNFLPIANRIPPFAVLSSLAIMIPVIGVIFLNSSIKFFLFCSLPAVSIRR